MDFPDRPTSRAPRRDRPGPGPVPARQMLERVKSAGIYLTAQRRAIIKVIAQRLHAFSVAGLSTEPALRRVSLVCIYRNLLLFEKISLVKRSFTRRGGFLFQTQPAGAPASITLACRKCGNRESITNPGIDRIQRELAQRGYASVEHWAEFAGVCPACARVSARLAQCSSGSGLLQQLSAGRLEYSTAGQ